MVGELLTSDHHCSAGCVRDMGIHTALFAALGGWVHWLGYVMTDNSRQPGVNVCAIGDVRKRVW